MYEGDFMQKFIQFLDNHVDFKIYSVTWIAIVTALSVIPCIKYLPKEFGYENGLLENIQMLFLFISCILAFKVKTNKKFFCFAGMVVIILILREINCGRTLFFPVPGEVNTFYGWKDIKYGYLAHPIYGLYIASTVVYFLWNKLFIDLLSIVKKIRFPFWNVLLLILGMTLGMYAEKSLSNMVFEEISELLFYVSLTGIIWLYGYNKKFTFCGDV